MEMIAGREGERKGERRGENWEGVGREKELREGHLSQQLKLHVCLFRLYTVNLVIYVVEKIMQFCD